MTQLSQNLKTLYQSYPETQFRYHTLEFYHSSFGYKYYYKTSVPGNKIFRLGPNDPNDPNADKSFVGSNFSLSEPSQMGNTNSLMTIDFDIQALDEFNRIIEVFEAIPSNFFEPIRVIYRIYHNQDVGIGQSQKETIVYVEKATLDPAAGVRLTLTTTNNLLVTTGEVYSIVDFPGLVTSD